jgi:hypothetical protein
MGEDGAAAIRNAAAVATQAPTSLEAPTTHKRPSKCSIHAKLGQIGLT